MAGRPKNDSAKFRRTGIEPGTHTTTLEFTHPSAFTTSASSCGLALLWNCNLIFFSQATIQPGVYFLIKPNLQSSRPLHREDSVESVECPAERTSTLSNRRQRRTDLFH